MRFSAVYLAAFCSWLLTACENPEEAANSLFVEASQIVTRALAEPDILKQHDQLAAADAAITRITAEFPGSNAAVRIAANEKVGPYSHADIKSALKELEARPEFCLRFVTRACVTSILTASLDKAMKAPQAESEAAHLAFLGWPYLTIVARAETEALVQPPEQRDVFLGEMAIQSFRDTTPKLLLMIQQAKGVDAAVATVRALADSPSFKAALIARFSDIAEEFLRDPDADAPRALEAIARAIADPPPPSAIEEIEKRRCQFGYTDKRRDLVAQQCTPAQILANNPTYYGLPYESFVALYDAASTPKLKTQVAKDAYSTGHNSTDALITWYEAAGYRTSKHLSSLYIRATADGHRARPKLIAELEQVPNPFPADPLTKAGLTDRNLALMHAQGTLVTQLPAIYQTIQAIPSYSDAVMRVLETLIALQPITPGFDLGQLIDIVSPIVESWPPDLSASRDAIRRSLLYAADTSTEDPKPLYDRYYRGKPYHTTLSAKQLLRFKANDHADIYDAAVAASKPIDHRNSIIFNLAYEDLLVAVANDDQAKVFAMLDAQPPIVRYLFIRYVLVKDDKIQKPVRVSEALRAAMIEKYPYDVAANEIGWNEDLGVPVAQKAETLLTHYKEVAEFTGTPPSRWLISSFGQLSPEVRRKAATVLHHQGDEHWVLYATAVALTEDEGQSGPDK